VKAEDRFVEKLQQILPHCGRVLVGPGDDAALITGRTGNLAATTDLLAEGADFLPGEDPESIGRRAVAVNLSDLAAMGVSPEFFLLSIAFPPDKGDEYPLAIARGAISRAEPFGAYLVGGDLSGAPTTVVSVALWGQPAGRPLLRSGAKPGDGVWLSGFPGRAAAGLRLARRMSASAKTEGQGALESAVLSPPHEEELLAAYRDPIPRVALGLWLAREQAAQAAIDVSDGLGVDAGRLARASGVRIVIERERLPVAAALAAFARLESADPVEWILAGGDDYELLFASTERAPLREPRPEWEVSITLVGHVEKGDGAILRDSHGDRDISELGYDHLETVP
jgi:thiamine-monophosphate kinase